MNRDFDPIIAKAKHVFVFEVGEATSFQLAITREQKQRF